MTNARAAIDFTYLFAFDVVVFVRQRLALVPGVPLAQADANAGAGSAVNTMSGRHYPAVVDQGASARDSPRQEASFNDGSLNKKNTLNVDE